MEASGSSNGASGGASDGAKKEKKNDFVVDHDLLKMISAQYWNITDKDRYVPFDETFKPAEYHLWGIRNKIIERSATLRDLVHNDSLNKVTDHQKTLDQVLVELSLPYRIVNCEPKNPSNVCVIYDVESEPRWSFSGVGSTEKEAIEKAACRGLQFFMVLST